MTFVSGVWVFHFKYLCLILMFVYFQGLVAIKHLNFALVYFECHIKATTLKRQSVKLEWIYYNLPISQYLLGPYST